MLGEPCRPFLRGAAGAAPAVGCADPGQDFGYQWQAFVCEGQGQSGDRRSGVELAWVGHLDISHDLRHSVKATFSDTVRLGVAYGVMVSGRGPATLSWRREQLRFLRDRRGRKN